MRRRSKTHAITATLTFVVRVVGLWSYSVPPPSLSLTPLRVGILLLTNFIRPVDVLQRREVSSEPKVFERYTASAFMVRRKWNTLAGELDVAYVGAAPFLVARASGVGIVAVASSNTEGSSLVVTYEIRSITNLHDMKIGSSGMGTIQDYMLTQVEKFSTRFIHFYAKVTDPIPYFEKRVQNLWADKKEREEEDIRRVCNVLCYSSGCDIPKVL